MSIVFIKLFTYEAIYIKNHYISIKYILYFSSRKARSAEGEGSQSGFSCDIGLDRYQYYVDGR